MLPFCRNYHPTWELEDRIDHLAHWMRVQHDVNQLRDDDAIESLKVVADDVVKHLHPFDTRFSDGAALVADPDGFGALTEAMARFVYTNDLVTTIRDG